VRGLDQGFPRLLGYNGTTAKSAAQTVLVTNRDDPLLAQWQYGLGRSVAWTSDSTGRWAKDWLAWKDFARFFSQLVSWTFPGEESGGIEATFDNVGGKTTLHVESVDADGSARDFYATSAVVVGSDPATVEPVNVDLVQVAPGIYEAPLGEVDPGAYAVRITQIRPGTSPLGRTVALVAPTSAEYRLLGGNEPFLAALRSATGGSQVLTPADPWRRDLTATSRSTDLWPLLLVLALLLWPLDIALRRVSVGRREFAAARAWLTSLGGRRGWNAPRTATNKSLLAARGRGSTSARSAMRADGPTAAEAAARGATPTTPTPDSAAEAPAKPAPVSTGVTAEDADTMSRLREAKRRARER